MTTHMMTATARTHRALPITIAIAPLAAGLDEATRRTLERLAHAIAPARCDAIGDCGCRCTLRAGHPGEIHEQYAWGQNKRYRLTGDAWAVQ